MTLPMLLLLLADGPVMQMTPPNIQAAIAHGGEAKEMPLYVLEPKKPGGIRIGPAAARENCGSYSTPFARVATRAYQAKREYKTLKESDLTPEELAPELWVFAAGNPRKRAANARNVVFVTKSGTVIQPAAFEPEARTYTNAFGAQAQGTEAFARFPLSALTGGGEIRVVYDSWECVVPVDPKKIR